MLDIDTSEADRVRVISRTTVWKGFVHLQKLVVEQHMRNGEIARFDREVHDHGLAAAVLLYDAGTDSVVLVRQFRLGAFMNGDHAFMLEIPAGLLDTSEEAGDAARREAQEETGYWVKSAHYLFDMYASPGAITEKVSLFFAPVDLSDRIDDGGGLADEHEDIEVVTMSLDAAAGLIATGGITDAKTIIVLQWAMLNRDRLAAGV
jgi:nudix-type nucleoside diphosphatase (YffH/AdpP family)